MSNTGAIKEKIQATPVLEDAIDSKTDFTEINEEKSLTQHAAEAKNYRLLFVNQALVVPLAAAWLFSANIRELND